MKSEHKVLEIDDYEQGIIVTALNDMRNGKIAEHKPTDAVDDILLKAIDAPRKKARIREYHEAR